MPEPGTGDDPLHRRGEGTGSQGCGAADAQVERVLAGKPCSMDEDVRGIIQKQGRLYTERLLSAAMEAGFDLKAIPVVMLGGGAAVVKRNVAPQRLVGSRLHFATRNRQWP